MRAAELSRLLELSGPQAGAFSAAQATELGVSRRQLTRAERSGVLRRVHPSVFFIGGGVLPPLARIHAAALAAGPAAVPSHESAFHLHGVDRVPFDVVVSTGPTGRTDLLGVRVHRVRDLVEEHLCVVDGVRTTTIERALVDVATCFSASRTAWLLDHLTITTRRTSLGRIARVVRQVNRRGRAGIGAFTTLLDARAAGPPLPRSQLERAADALLALTSLPVPIREYPLPIPDGQRAAEARYVDRAWPGAKLILEIDGRPWHSRERDMARDRRRDRQAAAAGWQTMRVLGEEVRDLPGEVADDVVSAYLHRLALLRSSD